MRKITDDAEKRVKKHFVRVLAIECIAAAVVGALAYGLGAPEAMLAEPKRPDPNFVLAMGLMAPMLSSVVIFRHKKSAPRTAA
jgi:hypothetical protein